MRKLLVLIFALIMANCSYCQLGNGYGSKVGSKFGTGKATGTYNGMNSYTGPNTYSSTNGYTDSVSIPKGVDYVWNNGGSNYASGSQVKTVMTKEVIESPTGTITKVTTTQQEPSGYGNSFGKKKREIGSNWSIFG